MAVISKAEQNKEKKEKNVETCFIFYTESLREEFRKGYLGGQGKAGR